MLRMVRTILILLFIIILFNISIAAENIHIYINGQEKTTILEPVIEDDVIYVKARSLANVFNASISWQQSIKTMSITSEKTMIRMMQNSPYIQLNNKTIKSKGSLKLIDGHTYIPLEEVSECFGYLYNSDDPNIYLTKPESYVQDISWQKEGQQLLIEMDNLSPYRINESDDPRKLVLELEKAALSEDFNDGISNRNFYLRVDKVPNQTRLKITIISQHPIPFGRNGGIDEEGDNLVINFLPFIRGIEWKDQQLEILTSGEVSRPDVSLLLEPRRLVIDMPGVMLSDFDTELAENDWIKDIRVSQFTYDPVVLRVVLELYPERHLHLAGSSFEEGRIVLQTAQQTTLDELTFEENSLKFISDDPINPDIFKLDEPDRLVINVLNAVRGDNFSDRLEVDHNLVKSIRTARFNEETVRIVADMDKDIGFQWQEEELSDGRILHTIKFENTYDNMLISDSSVKTDVNINFTGNIEYEIKEFNYPDRLVIDVQGINLSEDYQLPEPEGVIKSIRASQLSEEPRIARFVFETEDYVEYNVFSQLPDQMVNFSLIKEKEEESDILSDIIMIDAGHGGFDPGAIGPNGMQEKDLNLEIALKVEKLLKAAGCNVFLTRSDDTFISLKERVEIANEQKALLFVSIHINSSNSSYSEGTETFIAPAKVTDSLPLAEFLQDEMLARLKRPNRGIKRENFYVVKHTEMPSALVEIAFLSNPHEESLLGSDLFKKKAAEAISQGIIKYIEKFSTGR
ncbi:MAG: N-acetylmuramoyl-L-alanine amidase [Halanaerobiales bacterium]